MELNEMIFELTDSVEPDDPSIRHYVLADLSGLYAMTLSVLGLVIPFVFYSSDSGERNNAIVVAFYIYLYLGSLIALGYMHLNVRIHRRRRENKFLEKLKEKEQELKRDTPLSSNELIIRSCEQTNEDDADLDGGFSHGEEGLHFLTRVGSIGFAMASFIMDGLDLVSYAWEGSISFQCYGGGFIAVTVCRILFVYFVTSFIFKNHKILIHKHMALWKFLLGHLLATCLTLWSTTVIIEALESFSHAMHSNHFSDSDHYGDQHSSIATDQTQSNNHSDLADTAIAEEAVNLTTTLMTHLAEALKDDDHVLSHSQIEDTSLKTTPSLSASDCLTQDTIGVHASPYLFPFVIEFSLIAAAAMHHLYCRIKNKEELKPDAFRDVLIEASRGYECHKSTIGLFLGIFIFAVTVVFAAIYVAIVETDSAAQYLDTLGKQYFGLQTALNIVGIIAVIVCFYKMRSHGFSTHMESQLDQNLLLLSLGGYYFQVAFKAVAGGVNMVEGEGALTFYGGIHFGGSILSFIQMTMQTVFIINGFRMRSKDLTHVIKKPGRSALTFLLVLNMAMWIFNTFMQKMLTQSQSMTNFYGSTAWVIIFNMFLPLTIFYRFHSAICITEIWIEAYKLEEEVVHSEVAHTDIHHDQSVSLMKPGFEKSCTKL